MMNTILFDLDGTLLSMDTDEFIKLYFKAVAVKLKDYFTFEEVSKYFWQSTQYMINNTDPNSLILFTGSLYYVSEVIKKLKA